MTDRIEDTPLLSEPFNEHTPLPWRLEEDFDGDGESQGWDIMAPNYCVAGQEGFLSDCRPDAEFIVHACNTYYEREKSRKEDKAQIEALTKALRRALRHCPQNEAMDIFEELGRNITPTPEP